jgi:amidohydrolase family protein
LTRVGRYPGWCALLALAATTTFGADPLPIFDAHLHYNADAAVAYPVPAVLEILRRNGVRAVLATSVPNDGTRALLAAGSTEMQVVPFIRPYRTDADRATWFRDRETLTLIETELARGSYRGIGEFHVFGEDAGTEVMGRVIDLAVARGLYLHAHCDEPALERIFAHNAAARVIWAHTGFSTPPERVERWLERFPALWGELSYRYDITEEGHLKPEWRRLLLRHPDRFVIGSDTWINERWERYGEIIALYRGWLAELPADVAKAIAWSNAEVLFAR